MGVLEIILLVLLVLVLFSFVTPLRGNLPGGAVELIVLILVIWLIASLVS